MPAALIAAGLDWLEGLLPLLFVGFWILSQIMAVIRRVRGGDVVVERRPQRPVPEVKVARPEQPATDRAELERQVDEFLRARTGARPKPPAVVEPRKQQRPRDQKPRETDVARHVQEAFGHEIAHLETTLSRAKHDKHDKHAKQAEREQPAYPPAAVVTAADLAAMLRNPQTIRQVMLLREVLERPTERW